MLNLDVERRQYESLAHDNVSDPLLIKGFPTGISQGLSHKFPVHDFTSLHEPLSAGRDPNIHQEKSFNWSEPAICEPFSTYPCLDDIAHSAIFNPSRNFGSTLSFNPTASSIASLDTTSQDSRCSSPSFSTKSIDPSTRLLCEHCPGTNFAGTLKSQRRNLRRHRHTVHGIDERLSCLVSECNETFAPGRGDNRKRHMKLQHGLVPQWVESSLTKRTKYC